MAAFRSSRWSRLFDSLFFGTGRGVILLVPASLLLTAALRSWDQKPWLLLAGLATSEMGAVLVRLHGEHG